MMLYVCGTWTRLTRLIVIGLGMMIIPITASAPRDTSKQEVLEVLVEFRVFTPETREQEGNKLGRGASVNASQAETVTQFLNDRFHGRGIRFLPAFVEEDDSGDRLGGIAAKGELLKAVARYSQPGRITIVVPRAVSYSATFLNQSLESGPIAVYNGVGGTLEIARLVGQIIGFSKICDEASNIMFQLCGSQEAKPRLTNLDWTYFTNDPIAQSFPQVLNLWKWQATSYMRERREAALANRSLGLEEDEQGWTNPGG